MERNSGVSRVDGSELAELECINDVLGSVQNTLLEMGQELKDVDVEAERERLKRAGKELKSRLKSAVEDLDKVFDPGGD